MANYNSKITTNDYQTQWLGGLWKIAACACFACINGIVRYLSGGAETAIEDPLPIYIIVFWQNIFGTLFMGPWLAKQGITVFKTSHASLHIIRVVTAVLGICLFYLALTYMDIAQAIALSFTGPVFTVLGAKLFLRENINLSRALAIGISFTGAFIILRPDLSFFGDDLNLFALLPMGSAIAIACAKLSTRKLATAGESPATLTTFLLLFMAPVSLIPALFYWTLPSPHHMAWLVALGALATGAHYATSKAYALAEVTFLSPFAFSKFLLSVAVGYFAFTEFPEGWNMWIGTATILCSIMILTGNRPKVIRN